MDSQILLSEQSPTNPNLTNQSDKLDEALLLLSRLFGRQSALDYMRDPDFMTDGEAE